MEHLDFTEQLSNEVRLRFFGLTGCGQTRRPGRRTTFQERLGMAMMKQQTQKEQKQSTEDKIRQMDLRHLGSNLEASEAARREKTACAEQEKVHSVFDLYRLDGRTSFLRGTLLHRGAVSDVFLDADPVYDDGDRSDADHSREGRRKRKYQILRCGYSVYRALER